VTAYRPASAAALVLSLGAWTAAGRPDREATVELDPRLFTWLVNQASRRDDLKYSVNLGKPPMTVSLE